MADAATAAQLLRENLMRTADRSQRLRGPAIAAFVLDGIAAAALVSMMALGETRMTPRDGFLLSALLFGSFSALGSILIAAPEQRPVMNDETRLPERRRSDRRVIDLGSPTGIERRSGRDQRVAELALAGIFAPRPDHFGHEIRP
jgi:hypothetical protein